MATIELNEVLIEGEQQTLSMIARKGRLTCLTGGTTQRRHSWLCTLLGFEQPKVGVVSIDGEPMNPDTIDELRPMMAYVPASLEDTGRRGMYKAPTVQEVFMLRANRHLPISNGILAEEMKRTGDSSEQARLLAVATLLDRPILIVESPSAATAVYLTHLARSGKTVIVGTDDTQLLQMADETVTLE